MVKVSHHQLKNTLKINEVNSRGLCTLEDDLRIIENLRIFNYKPDLYHWLIIRKSERENILEVKNWSCDGDYAAK